MTSKHPKIRTRFDRDRRTVKLAEPPQDSLTQQQFKDECDMNRIVKNAMRGVTPRFMRTDQPQYGDFADVPDLHRSFELIQAAEQAFSALPAELRLELNNDPRNITQITLAQSEKYKLGKPPADLPEPHEDPLQPARKGSAKPKPDASSPKAVQAATAGTEPADD